MSLLVPLTYWGIELYLILGIIAGTILLALFINDRTGIKYPGILLLLFSLIIMIRADYTNSSIKGYVEANIVLSYIAFLASFWLSRETLIYKKAFPFILWGAFTIYGLISFITLLHGHNDNRLSVIFEHPNHLGNVLAFAVIFCFASVIQIDKSYLRILSWTLIGFLIAALAHTLSRGAWLGCITGLSMSILYLWKGIPAKQLLSALAILIVIASVTVSVSFPENISNRFSTNTPDTRVSISNRLLLWNTATKMIKEHWLTGVGVAAFGEVLRRDYQVAFANSESFDSALNNYLTLAVEAGVPALLVYLAAITFACAIAGRSISHAGLIQCTNVGLLCGVYSILVFSSTTYTLSRAYAVILVWSVLGYLVADGQEAYRRDETYA
ncbi:MAG: O-antigen ligase family protein, partial [bacterium]|nr:O-antigen ligase family protein [bacterium]